jgi:hypothetical protein
MGWDFSMGELSHLLEEFYGELDSYVPYSEPGIMVVIGNVAKRIWVEFDYDIQDQEKLIYVEGFRSAFLDFYATIG